MILKKFYGIELLRFFTSLSVVLFHYSLFFSPSNDFSDSDIYSIKEKLPFYDYLEFFYTYGNFGVPVFYTISGFVFAHVYLYLEKKITCKTFFVNRFARLYPLHLGTLILVALLQYINFFDVNYFLFTTHNNFYYDFYHFFLQLFLISSWGFEHGPSFNTPIWSVSVEVAIYIIFFLVLDNLQKHKLFLTISISALLLVLAKTGLEKSLFLECARLFFSGILVYLIVRNLRYNKYLIFISLLLLIISFVGNFKIYLFCPSLLMFFSIIDEFIKNKKIRYFFQIGGNLTYSLYLLHISVQIFIIMSINKLNIEESIYLSNYFLIFYVSIMILISYFSFRVYEKPLNILIRKKFNNN
tara:strand:- start:2122 stop:3186 length:1065 start_codon:yes stop_codon:yes gene_type:complete